MNKIRYANIDDSKELGYIHATSWKIAYKEIIPDEFLDDITPLKRQEYFEKAMTNQWEENAMIFKSNQPVGLIGIGKSRDEDKSNDCGEIKGIYLLPEYFNMGIGYELITWGINELKKKNYTKVTLWVLEENIKARRFYERVGFKFDNTTKVINLGKELVEYRYEMDI